jgi:N,N'-diacetyllegionaminate synthase
MKNKTLIIAEAGVNHNGDIMLAKQLIVAAAEAGADLVKFQTFNAGRQVTRNAHKAFYQTKTSGADETQYEMLKRLELSSDMHDELLAHCRQTKIGFLSTGFDIPAVRYLNQLGLRLYKIPSGEITNLPYLRYIGALGGDLILSSGMCKMSDIEAAVDVLEQAGTPRTKIVVLHCTTEYPTPMAEVNLRAMNSMRSAFGVRVGYSDHTSGIEVAIAATALGACVIEKHFTLDRNLPGPDHQASIEPDELKAMVRAIRNIGIAMGDGIKRMTPSEVKNVTVVRKSLVAARPIRVGELITSESIAAKRPGTGISPMRWDEVVGRRAPRDFATDELIDL